MKNYKLGIIGCGNMSTAIWQGVLKGELLKAEEILVSDLDEAKLAYALSYGVNSADNLTIAENCEYVLWAVKPQCFPTIAQELKGKFKAKAVLSIMAGVSVDTLANSLDISDIIRIMPNTPCMVCKGMSALCFRGCDAAAKRFAHEVFSTVGEVTEIEENKFDAVTSVSGSGPAYVYMFLKGLVEGGIEGGLTYEEAKALGAATLQGAAELAKQSTKSLDELTDAVCSKGGTTIEAVKVYKNDGLVELVKKGVRACRYRSMEMSGKLPIKQTAETAETPCANGLKKVIIYTDGACSVNPGPGGWAAILSFNGTEKEFRGGEKDTTNNRMELLAVINALDALKEPCEAEIYSDSAYVVNAVEKGWLYGWKRNGWRNSSKDEVKNIDLWERLITQLSAHHISFVKVKGHADNDLNNRCDKIAREEAQKLK